MRDPAGCQPVTFCC